MTAASHAARLLIIACAGILGAILLGLALLNQQRQHNRKKEELLQSLREIERRQRELNHQTWGPR